MKSIIFLPYFESTAHFLVQQSQSPPKQYKFESIFVSPVQTQQNVIKPAVSTKIYGTEQISFGPTNFLTKQLTKYTMQKMNSTFIKLRLNQEAPETKSQYAQTLPGQQTGMQKASQYPSVRGPLKYCGVRANFDFNKCLCNNCA
ncbi:Hypothetical_protein [Hexamita inflata]|uniref:Hypothetical_protein n=1 Tax=Hexamita inflata TaxID=28002 RepID=A0AA86R0S2_9EUKA|nr:Hypothetical protein HINF_LOCUS51278 [Hexamita inflata]